jgi:integrase
LGHSSISVTMDIYSHVLPRLQEEATRRFAERFIDLYN